MLIIQENKYAKVEEIFSYKYLFITFYLIILIVWCILFDNYRRKPKPSESIKETQSESEESEIDTPSEAEKAKLWFEEWSGTNPNIVVLDKSEFSDKPTYEQIFSEINNQSPYMQNIVPANYAGLKVHWLLTFIDIRTYPDVSYADIQFHPKTFCTLDLDKRPEFKTMKQGTPFDVCGVIKEVIGDYITLEPHHITYHEKTPNTKTQIKEGQRPSH